MIVRSLLLLIPLSLWSWYVIQPHRTSRQITATFLGFVWAFHAVLISNIILYDLGMLVFPQGENLFYHVPFDWVFSLAVLFGAVLPLLRHWIRNWLAHVIIQGIMFAILYSSQIVEVHLAKNWLIILLMSLTTIPAMWLSEWTENDRDIGKRAVLQAIGWAVLLFWLFPSIIFHLTDDSWAVLLQRDILTNTIFMMPLLLPAYLLLSALYQFAVYGDGTAFPYDPPKKLVTGGIYQYLSNPMQVGICVAMAWWGVVLQSLWISLSAVIAVVLFIVFKDVCNGSCAIGLNNPEWEDYQRCVRKWWPRTRYRLYRGK